MKICNRQHRFSLSIIGTTLITLSIANNTLASSCTNASVIIENQSKQAFSIEAPDGGNLVFGSRSLPPGSALTGKLNRTQGELSGIIEITLQNNNGSSSSPSSIKIPYSFSTGSLITQPCLPKAPPLINDDGFIVSSQITQPTAGGRNALIKFTVSNQ